MKRKGRAAGANKTSSRGDNEFPDKRNNDQDDVEEEEEEEDYIDEYDEEASARNQTKAFVYVGADGKLIYVPHEDDQGDDDEREGCKEVEKNVNVVDEEEKDEVKEIENDIKRGDDKEGDVDSVAVSVLNSRGDDTCTVPPISDDAAQAEGEEEDHLQQQRRWLSVTKEEENSEWPLPRIRHALAVRGNIIYVFGGLLEVRDREYTLDDCWALDLRTR